jgi:hypothetical protein
MSSESERLTGALNDQTFADMVGSFLNVVEGNEV